MLLCDICRNDPNVGASLLGYDVPNCGVVIVGNSLMVTPQIEQCMRTRTNAMKPYKVGAPRMDKYGGRGEGFILTEKVRPDGAYIGPVLGSLSSMGESGGQAYYGKPVFKWTSEANGKMPLYVLDSLKAMLVTLVAANSRVPSFSWSASSGFE